MDARPRRVGLRGGAALTVLAWAGLVAAWLELLGGRAQDDVYILYRYASNLAGGHGLVFNPGERVFGLSEPGAALLLAGLHRLTGIEIPELGSLVFGLALFALATLVWVAAGRRGRWPEGVLGGTLLLAWSLIWVSHGAGAPLFLAFLVGAALLLEAAPRVGVGGTTVALAGAGAGILAGLAVWVRPDAAAGVALLGLLAWRRHRRPPVVFALTGAAVVVAGAGAAWLYFGSVLPQTLEAKRTIRAAFDPAYGAADFWHQALAVAGRHTGGALWLLLALAAAGSVSLWRGAGLAGKLLVAFAGAVAVTYSVARVGHFSWYLLPVEAALVYGLAFGAGGAARRVARGVRRARSAGGSALPAVAAGAVALALVVPVALPLARASHDWATSFSGFGRLNAYRELGEWIAATTSEDVRVAALEIGVLGYSARRPLGDLLGLVSPESIPHVARRDLVGALREQDADLVVARSQGRMRRVVASPWFQRTYEEAIRVPVPNGRAWVAVYRRRP